MRRVVISGLGIVSSIGADAAEVTASLRDAKSGITFSPDFAENGFRCQVWGKPTLDPTELVDRRVEDALSGRGLGHRCLTASVFGFGRSTIESVSTIW